MLIPICHTCSKPIDLINRTPECCQCYHPCSDGVTYLPCVIYGLHDSKSDSDLICLGIPRKSSLMLAVLTIYRKILRRIKVVDSDSMDLKFECGVLSMDVIIDPTSTVPYSIGPDGLKLDCCLYNCGNIISNFDFDITEVDRTTNFFTRSELYHFSLNDQLTGIHFVDNSSIIGDDLVWLSYTDLLDNGSYTFYSVGDNFIMPVNACARDLKGVTKQFIFEAYTKNGCYINKICDHFIERVPYSERYTQAYRANMQINNLPILNDYNVNSNDKGILYFADTAPLNASQTLGGAIRKLNLNTKDISTISGSTSNLLAPTTVTNTLGTDAEYNAPSAICMDKNEISNNEPVLYFTVFRNGDASKGGVLIRLVKESNGNCDERANWKTYIIAGTGIQGNQPIAVNTDSPGNTTNLGALYGAKMWYNINGYPSFYLMDTSYDRIRFVYYSGNGNINSSASWNVRTVTDNNISGWAVQGGLSSNLNIENIPNGRRLIVMGASRITFFDFTGIANPNNSASITALNSWTSEVVISNIASSNDGVSIINTINSTSTGVHNPSHIFKYNHLGIDYYIFGQEFSALISNSTVVRTFFKSSPTNYTFTTICKQTIPGGYGSTGTYSNPGPVNGLSCGFFTDLLGNLYDITLGGVRQWSLGSNTCYVFSGGANANDTQLEYSNLPIPVRIDTEYKHGIDCDPNNCDIPVFTVSQVQSTSAVITITNYDPSYSYDLSLDGGLNYPYMGIFNPFVLNNLSPNTTYDFRVKVHCNIGLSQNSSIISITTPSTPIVTCPPFYFSVTGVTQNSFYITILSGNPGDLYSVSVDGGLTYVITNTIQQNIFVSGLTPNTSYSIVVKKETALGAICYSGPYNIKTLSHDSYCIEFVLVTNLTLLGFSNIYAILKNQLGQPVNALSNIPVSVIHHDPSTQTSTTVNLTITVGTSQAISNPIAGSLNSYLCYDRSQFTNCDPLNINNPCPCNLNPCTECVCVEIIEHDFIYTFALRGCDDGTSPLAAVPITISWVCNGLPGSITIPANQNSAQVYLVGCAPNTMTNITVTPSSIGICT